MTSRKPTAEEAALFAVMQRDDGEAMRLLREFLPSELVGLDDYAAHLRTLIRSVTRERS